MSDTSEHVPVKTHDNRGKFAAGNKLGRAPKNAVLVQRLRAMAIQYFTDHPEELLEMLDIMKSIARDTTAPHAARVAAGREVLNRGLGNVDITIKVEDGEEQVKLADPVELGRRMLALGVPWEKLPPEVQAVTPRAIVATVTDKEQGT